MHSFYGSKFMRKRTLTRRNARADAADLQTHVRCNREQVPRDIKHGLRTRRVSCAHCSHDVDMLGSRLTCEVGRVVGGVGGIGHRLVDGSTLVGSFRLMLQELLFEFTKRVEDARRGGRQVNEASTPPPQARRFRPARRRMSLRCVGEFRV